jgi:hypothetical protein
MLLCGILVLVTGGSARAQKPIVIIGPPTPFDQTISIEDDGTGSFLMVNTGSGKYTFTRCSDGLKVEGIGFIRVDGCAIFLEDTQSDHRVVASINECDAQGKAVFETFAPRTTSPHALAISIAPFGVAPFRAVLLDANMGNNLMDCGSKK